MLTRLAGALVRALVVVLVMITPSVLLPDITRSSQELALIIGALCGGFALFEYVSSSPGFVDFRFAPPYNRMRVALLASLLIVLSLLIRALSTGSENFAALGQLAQNAHAAVSFPYSPVTVATAALSKGNGVGSVVSVVLGYSFVHVVAGTVLILAFLWLLNWPADRRGFNLWLNLPTFEPMEHHKAAARLQRDGWMNIVLGVALFYILPFPVVIVLGTLDDAVLNFQQPLVWVAAIWAFLPATMIIRGGAILKICHIMRRVSGARTQPATA